jgi:hypothetical protein
MKNIIFLKRILNKHGHRLLFVLMATLITFIYRFPDVYAYLTTPSEMVYLGHSSWFDPHDVNIYASVIHYAQSGHIFLPNLWTAVPNQPILIFPVEMLFGFLFRFVDSYLLLWLSSIFCGLLLIFGIFWLLRRTGISYLMSLITTIGITLGGGFGFIFYPKNIPSSDILNAITFYEAFYKPHEAIALLLYLFSLVMFYDVFINRKTISLKMAFLISLSSTISFLIYPYFIASYGLITFPILLALNKRSIRKLSLYSVLLYIPAGLSVLYMAVQMYFVNQGFGESLIQHLDTALPSTVFGYGVLSLIFLYQLFFMPKTSLMKYLNWWIIVSIALALIPVGPGKIFLRGLFFPLVLLVVLQLKVLMEAFSSNAVKIVFWTIFLVLLCATNIYIMLLRNYAAHSVQSTDIIYMPKEEYKVFNYLNKYTDPNSGILALYTMSNFIPAFTQNRSCIGSLGSVNKKYVEQVSIVQQFYEGRQISKNFLKEYNVSYVLWGPEEQRITRKYIGEDKDLSKIYKNLELVFETMTTKLYQVIE